MRPTAHLTDQPVVPRRRLPAVGLVVSLAAATLALLPSTVPASAAEAPPFTDLDGNVHAPMVAVLAEAGITTGCGSAGDARYCPDGLVTRAQLSSFLGRALSLPAGEVDHFDDDDASVHEPAINRLHDEGIAFGVAERAFAPDATVTRAQMASFLVRALGLQPEPGARFVDVDGAHQANINAIATAGITSGCDAEGTRFCPQAPVRRDQMASFLTRALGLHTGEATLGPAAGSAPVAPPAVGGTGAPGTEEATPTAVDPGAPPMTDGSLPPPRYVSPVNRPATAPLPEDVLASWTDEQVSAAPPAALDRFAAPAASPDSDAYHAALYPPEEPYLQGTSNWAQPRSWLGRLLYRTPTGSGYCSATVVGRDTILTAAHCVVGRDGRGYSDFVFIPGKLGTSEPYGRWGGGQATYFTDYLGAGAAAEVLDYALVHIPPTATGVYLGDLVGTLPVLLNSHTLALPRYAMGYPGEGWFGQWGGDYPWFCSSSDVQWYQWDTAAQWASKGSGCAANGGFSGGPVLELWNGTWWVAGVSSTMGYAEGDDGTLVWQDPAFAGARARNWLHNLWSPSFNSWYDDLVAQMHR